MNVTSIRCKVRHLKTTNYTRQSIDGYLKYFFLKNLYVKKRFENLYVSCTMVLYEYTNLLRNYIYNLFFNTHVRIQIYREFYHIIIYIANEGRHVRTINYHLWLEMDYIEPNCGNTRVPLVEQGLNTLSDHVSLPTVVIGFVSLVF